MAATGNVSSAQVASDDEYADSQAEARTDTAIAPGFQLQLNSTQDTKLNGHYRVRSDGTVQLPYGVTISTDGMTLEDFKKR